MTVPIAMSPGRGGFTPQLALSYDSGAGNSPYGLGWNIGLPSISRKTTKGLPQYDGLPKYYDETGSDVFIGPKIGLKPPTSSRANSIS